MLEQPELETSRADALLAAVALPRSGLFFPLGYSLRIEANSQEVIAAAYQAWGAFPQRSKERPIRISVTVSDSRTALPEPPVFHPRDHLMAIVSDAENFLMCEYRSGFAFGCVTPATVADHGFFRYHFLEAAAMSLIAQLYLASVHGALVQLDGRGVLLCGDSHAGKSTLAYACARAGWTFISDDATSLIRDSEDRYAIGNPHSLRLREDAKLLFPELDVFLAGVRPNGKIGIEVVTDTLPGISTADGSSIDHVVFLNRQAGALKLVRFDSAEALCWFEQFSMAYGSKDVQDSQNRAYRRLLRANTWELRYHDLDNAVERLERLVRSGG